MKIAMVSSWQEACGIANYTGALVAELRKRVEVEVIPLPAGQHHPDFFRKLGQACAGADLAHIQHEYIYFGGRRPGAYRWPDFLENLKIPYVTTLHTWLRPSAGGSWWKRSLRSGRDGLLRLAGWTPYLEAGQVKQAQAVIVHTGAHRQFLIQRGIAPERVWVLPQGVPPAVKGRAPEILRKRGQASGPVVTLFGFLNPAKGHLLAINAWNQIQGNAVLVIAGKAFSEREAAYARRVQAAAAALGKRVQFSGYLEDRELSGLLDASEVVLMPYTSATSSYALSLALSRGCAVLASNLESFQEIQQEQPCLELFKAGDAGDLVLKLNGLLNNAPQRSQLSRAAKTWAKGHAWARVAGKTLGIYSEVLKIKRG